MKICQIVSRIDEEASGPTYSVPRLSESLYNQNNEILLATLKDRVQGKEREFDDIDLKQFKAVPFISKLGISPEMRKWFALNAAKFDVIHTHGLWMMPNIYPMVAAYNNQVISVVSPRGTLSEAALRYSSKVKTLFWYFRQKSVLDRATAFHATSEAEYLDIRRAGFRQPVVIIPNGIDIGGDIENRENVKRKTVISLGRIHPKKGLEMAIEVWATLENKYPEWHFDIVGLGRPSYVSALKLLIKDLKLERVKIFAPVYGQEKAEVLARSRLFLLSTHNENFGMVIAEALAAGVPAISTKGAPWAGLKIHKCGWWVDRTEESVKNAMIEAMNLPDTDLQEMGRMGRDWMADDFSWQAIGQKMNFFYSWLKTGGEAPSYIRIAEND